jgi:hypothetical protein
LAALDQKLRPIGRTDTLVAAVLCGMGGLAGIVLAPALYAWSPPHGRDLGPGAFVGVLGLLLAVLAIVAAVAWARARHWQRVCTLGFARVLSSSMTTVREGNITRSACSMEVDVLRPSGVLHKSLLWTRATVVPPGTYPCMMSPDAKLTALALEPLSGPG